MTKLGVKFLVEPAGVRLTAQEMSLLEQLQPAGIGLRSRNFVQNTDYHNWLKAYSELIQQCKQVIHRDRFIVCIDHEGGRVVRPPLPITRFPYATRWACAASEVGKAMGIELKSLGINVNFAPVADINSNPKNPVIAERALGSTPQVVAEAAVKFAKALYDMNVLPCAKHFPGHGDTIQDSHFDLPVLELTREELCGRELVPFQALVDIAVPLVMTAHILFPKIDAHTPATLSKEILQVLLRNEMGFDGVVVADALGMAAVSSSFTENETLVKAVNAGLDLFLIVGDNVDISLALKLARLLEKELTEHKIDETLLQDSLSRIERLLNSLPQNSIETLAGEVFLAHEALAAELTAKAPQSNFKLKVPGFE